MPLTIGLGRNSPITLETDPRKYEGLIVRHGQWVRWLTARKCSCVLTNNRTDPQCPLCRGQGWRYAFQAMEEDKAVEAKAVDTNLVEMPYDIEASKISLVQDGAGTIYPIDSVYGKWVKVKGNPFLGRELVYVSVSNPRQKYLEGLVATYLGHGFVQLDDYELEGPWMRVPFDITGVSYVRKADGTELVVREWSVDKIILDTTTVEPAVGERLHVAVEYMPPYKIAILGQNISEMDQRYIQEVGGNAIAVFPYPYKVSEQDIVTTWSGTQIRKKLLRKTVGDTDIMPDLFVSKILRLEDTERVYEEGTHFIIWDRNTIRWIVDKALRPAEGKNYSVEYEANVSYRVMSQFPSVRSSENKRFPSKVAVKLVSGLTEGTEA